MKDSKVEVLPSRLFKYYAFDSTLNQSRLTGSVYLASPWDFNDPNDCQLEVHNNVNSIKCNDDWIKSKLLEVGITTDLDNKVNRLRSNDLDVVKEVRSKQLEKLGVLCLTESHDNNIIWGYYTNNKGFCVEYDRDLIVKRIIIGFINNLSWEQTERLFVNKEYSKEPIKRDKTISRDRLEMVQKLFVFIDIKSITNNFLRDKDKNEQLYFIQNLYLKRFGCGHIDYSETPSITTPTLFYDKNSEAIKVKYYTKSIEWKNEQEYRLTMSLGGRMIINIGKDCIKSIRLGCNISIVHLFEIISILYKNDMTHIELISMHKDGNKLSEIKLDVNNLIEIYNHFQTAAHK